MRKHILNIPFVVTMCLCAGVLFDNAFAAGSVRSLGGNGTYNGTTAAAAATHGAAATARVGSLRISPTKPRTLLTGMRTNSDGTTTPTERLSIGKFLNGATSVSSSGGGGSMDGGASAAQISELNTNIQQLFSTIGVIEGDITNLENTKQDKLTAGDYIIIANNEVSLDITALGNDLATSLDVPIEIRYNTNTDALEWTKDGTNWATLLNISDLLGDYVSATELSETIATLATKSAVESLTERVTTAEGAITGLQTTIYGNSGGEEAGGLVDDVAALQNTVESMADVAFSGSYNDLVDTPNNANFQIKPTTGVAAGKVLTYTSDDANTNVSASYIMVPVATAAPSTVAPTGFVELWVQ